MWLREVSQGLTVSQNPGRIKPPFTSKTNFQSMNHTTPVLLWDGAYDKAEHQACESWGQSILGRGDPVVEQSSRGDQANPESDYL